MSNWTTGAELKLRGWEKGLSIKSRRGLSCNGLSGEALVDLTFGKLPAAIDGVFGMSQPGAIKPPQGALYEPERLPLLADVLWKADAMFALFQQCILGNIGSRLALGEDIMDISPEVYSLPPQPQVELIRHPPTDLREVDQLIYNDRFRSIDRQIPISVATCSTLAPDGSVSHRSFIKAYLNSVLNQSCYSQRVEFDFWVLSTGVHDTIRHMGESVVPMNIVFALAAKQIFNKCTIWSRNE